MKKIILTCLIITTVALAGCNEERQTSTPTERGAAQLIFSFPTQNQGYVATSSPVYLRFSSPITTDDLEPALRLERLQGENGEAVAINSTLSDDRRTLILTPEKPLAPAARYRVMAEELTSENRPVGFPATGIEFETRLAITGPLLERIDPEASEGFTIVNLVPDGSNFPLTNLASLRMQFNEPLDPQSTRYGDSVILKNAEGKLVPAELLVKGQNLTLDPDDDLVPGSQYTLSLTSAIRSTLGGELNPGSYEHFTFTPERAGGRANIPLKVASHQQSRRSSLSGELINSVNLASAMMGPLNLTYMGPDTGPLGDRPVTGDIFADLANVANYADVTPLRIRKGALMTGTDVAINVAGALPAGLNSGTVKVRFLSDANGFMVPNPYSTSSTAPKNILMFVDIAMNAGNPTANAALGQELLNVPVVGTVGMKEGALYIDAMAVIEPQVMGIDQASGLVSFRLEGYRHSQNAPATGPADATAPKLLSAVPGNNVDSLRPGDPLILYFDQPLKRSSVEKAISLDDSEGGSVEYSLAVDGSNVVIRPDRPLRHGRTYTLTADGLQGVNGETALVSPQTFSLAPTQTGTSQRQSPLVLTTLPGFPCAKTDATPDMDSAFQGRCAGGHSSDDRLPIQRHPADRPIIVRFSQNMHPASLKAGITVKLERNQGDGWESFDDFVLEVDAREIRLQPLQVWDSNTLYRYTLVSSPGMTGTAIYSDSGLPLQTQLLSPSPRKFNNRRFGGPDMVNYFRGGEASGMTLVPLRNLPAADANADLALNPEEQGIEPDSDGKYRASANSANVIVAPDSVQSALVDNVNIGCRVRRDCPGDQFLYLTAMLDVEIDNKVMDDDPGKIAVIIDPTVIYTTDLDVHIRIDDSRQPICAYLCNVGNLIGGVDQLAPSGPMLMRMRHGGAARDEGITGFIYNDEDTGQLMFEISLDLYLDAPYLEIDIPLTKLDHNMRSFPINDLVVRGPVDFLDDGRLQINLRNTQPVDMDVSVTGKVLGGLGDIFVGSPDTEMRLTIPAGELVLNYLSPYTLK